jgi:hypothetical protein
VLRSNDLVGANLEHARKRATFSENEAERKREKRAYDHVVFLEVVSV